MPPNFIPSKFHIIKVRVSPLKFDSRPPNLKFNPLSKVKTPARKIRV